MIIYIYIVFLLEIIVVVPMKHWFSIANIENIFAYVSSKLQHK